MTQLYAKIKRSSKYHNQNSYHVQDDKFIPFEVIYDERQEKFLGGVGGNYPVDDLNLFVKQDEAFVRVGK